MTEIMWLECSDAHIMLRSLSGDLNPRKVRLLLCAYYRRFWHLLTTPEYRESIEGAEKYAEGEVDQSELAVVRERVRDTHWNFIDLNRGGDFERSRLDQFAWPRRFLATIAVAPDNDIAKFVVRSDSPSIGWREVPEEGRFLCTLVREIFGKPFHSSASKEDLRRSTLRMDNWRAWNDGTIPMLAEAIYKDHAFDRLPILADALEDAGCDNGDILAHCRSGEEHVRGCWVVDLLLGKT